MNTLKRTIKAVCLALAGWMTCAALALHAEEVPSGTLAEMFSRKVTIEVTGYAGAETLANFPVLVRLAAGNPKGFSYDEAGVGGSGIRFADKDGNLIPHEIDVWNPEGTSFVWVKIPELKAATETEKTTFTMYYKAAADASLPEVASQDVWNSSYSMVYHMNDNVVANGTAINAAHATDFHGTFAAANPGATVDVLETDVGPVGNVYSTTAWDKGFTFTGSPARDQYTFSGWAKIDHVDNSGIAPFIHGTSISSATYPNGVSAFFVSANAPAKTLRFNFSANGANRKKEDVTTPDAINEWVHFTGVVDGTNAKIYINGGLYSKSLTGITQDTSTTFTCAIAKFRYDGKVDEMRISTNRVHSADWVNAEYQTMANAAFLTLGDAEPIGESREIDFSASGSEQPEVGYDVTLSGKLMALGAGATKADVLVEYRLQGATTFTQTVAVPFTTAPADVAITLEGLTPGATYDYRFVVTNDAGTPQTLETPVASFTVQSSTIVSDALTVTHQNCNVTVSGSFEQFGLGTTTIELWIGTTSANLKKYATLTFDENPKNGAFTFDPVSLPPGNYEYVVKATNSNGTLVGSDETPIANTTVVDNSTYTWIGGNGSWSDAANWSSEDSGARALPTTTSTVVIKPTQDIVIELVEGVTVSNLNFSTAAGAITFRGVRGELTDDSAFMSLNAQTGLTMDGASSANALTFESINLSSSGTYLTNPDRVSKLVVTKGSIVRFRCAWDIEGEVCLSSGSSLYNCSMNYASERGNALTARKLVAGTGYNRLHTKAVFGGYETIGQAGVIRVCNGGYVQFTDSSGIPQSGGITTHFTGTSDVNERVEVYGGNLGVGAIRIDESGVLRAMSWGKTGLEDVTENDNVNLTTNATLDADLTVNALYCQAALNLNGYTLTVKSGMVAFSESSVKSAAAIITNGTVVLPLPTYFYDNVMSGVTTKMGGIRCDIQAGGNPDWFTTVGLIGDYDTSHFRAWAVSCFSNTVGTVRVMPNQVSNLTSGRPMMLEKAPGVIWDYECGWGGANGNGLGNYLGTFATYLSDTTARRPYNGHFRGLGGDGFVLHALLLSDAENGSLWLGDKKGGDTIAPLQLVVGENGYLLPGAVDYAGHRTGAMRFYGHFPARHRQGYTNLLFKTGSKFCVTVREDGECTYIRAPNWGGATQKTKVRIEGGDIVVTKAGKFTPPKGEAYAVIRADFPIEGAFDTVTPGWKVQLSEDKKTLTLVSSPLGFSIIVR